MVHRLFRGPRGIMRLATMAAVTVLLMWLVLVIFTDRVTRQVASDTLTPMLALAALGSLLWAAWRSLPVSRQVHRAWGCFVVAMALDVLGALVVGLYDILLGRLPAASWADPFFLGCYAAIIAGLMLMPSKPVERPQHARAALDIGMALLAALLLLWNFVVGPFFAAGGSAPLPVQLVSMAYPLLDVFLFGAVLLVSFRQVEAQAHGPLTLMLVSLTAQLAADSISSYQTLQGIYFTGSLVDTGWIFALLGLSLAGVLQATTVGAASTSEQAKTRTATSLQWARYIPYLWIPPAYGLLVWGHGQQLGISYNTLALGVGVVIALVILRQVLTLAENGLLYRQLQAELGGKQRAAQALQVLNEELEQRVTQRTAALAQANESLRQEVQERVKAEEALRRSEERYALAARGANDGLWDWDLQSNRIYYSARWKEMLGFPDDGIGDSPDFWFNRVHPDDLEMVRMDLDAHLRGVSPQFHSEHRVLHHDGTYRWVLSRALAVCDRHGIVCRLVGSQSDVTDRKRAEEQLQHNAFYDALTGLPNRALFMDRLERAVERAGQRPEGQFAVLFLDFDRFKVVNDSLGHSVGDELLAEAAYRLRTCLRAVDTVARLGGDEFVILLEDIDGLTSAVHVAERVEMTLRHPFALSKREVFTSVSMGIALGGQGRGDPDDLLRDADIALYRAKATGRARHVVFDAAMHVQARARLELESDIRGALERHEFRVHYQPIITLADDRVSGFEALVRWQHPRLGLLPPAEFLPLAEETGLILAIDHWVLREACQQMRTWQEDFPSDPPLTLSVSVNLSAREFTEPGLVRLVREVLEETGLAACSLSLEITEGVIIGDTPAVTGILTQLRELGVRVQIDDFGTGYSSLSYLQQFPIETIKIDRSFIDRLNVDEHSSEIVRTIIHLAHDLGMDATAEGVETPEQLAKLRTLDCEYGQGYLISRPLDDRAATALLAGDLVSRPQAETPVVSGT
jgi:diguanylate cyclase (GGDEF)-like protein/PAS domain S-box-containing protein